MGETEGDACGDVDGLAEDAGDADLAGGGEDGELGSCQVAEGRGAGGVEGRGVGREEAAAGDSSPRLPAGELLVLWQWGRLGRRLGLKGSRDCVSRISRQQGVSLGLKCGQVAFLGRSGRSCRRQAPKVQGLVVDKSDIICQKNARKRSLLNNAAICLNLLQNLLGSNI